MSARPRLDREHVLPVERYGPHRERIRERMRAVRAARRIELGAACTGQFENWETLWHQVQETAFVERLSPTEIGDEVAAFAPLVPAPGELVLRLDFRRDGLPSRCVAEGGTRLEGIEAMTRLWIDDACVRAEPAAATPAALRDGAANLVRVVVFRLPPAERLRFEAGLADVDLEVAHPCHRARRRLPRTLRAWLAADREGP